MPVVDFIVAGGLLKNPLVMQVYADVLRRPIHVIESEQAPALGSAMHAAVAAGVHPGHRGRGRRNGAACDRDAWLPDPRSRRRVRPALRGVSRRSTTTSADASATDARLRSLRREALAHDHLHHGHRRGRSLDFADRGHRAAPGARAHTASSCGPAATCRPACPGQDLMVIKPSGVGYDDLTPESMVVCDLDGTVVDGDLAPSSDTASHAYVYRHMPHVGGVTHTHSTYAVAWAARGEPVPCVLTAMADEFGGPIPLRPVRPDRHRRHRQGRGRRPPGLAPARRCWCRTTARSPSAPTPAPRSRPR